MKLITAVQNGAQIVCVLDKSGKFAVGINTLGLSHGYAGMNALISGVNGGDFEKLTAFANSAASAGADVFEISTLELAAPIPRPAHDIICLGKNYAAHAREFGSEPPENPVIFAKRAAVTTGHNGVIDGHLDVDDQLDYEVELAVIIGRECRKISEEEVEGCIFGYTVFNDFSSRKLQNRHQQWYLGKSGDSFAALGPCIVTRDEICFPLELTLQSRVNGEVRQNSNTALFLHDVPKVIALLSRTITLEAGDIIATGTPSGVGMGFNPPRFLKSGDVVECEIKGIGTLTNKIK